MKTFKILHIMNIIFYSLTMLCFISVYGAIFGAILEFYLGIFQVVFALLISWKYDTLLTNKHKKQLKHYWTITTIILCFIGVNTTFNLIESTDTLWMLILSISMLVATYFVRITYLIQKQK